MTSVNVASRSQREDRLGLGALVRLQDIGCWGAPDRHQSQFDTDKHRTPVDRRQSIFLYEQQSDTGDGDSRSDNKTIGDPLAKKNPPKDRVCHHQQREHHGDEFGRDLEIVTIDEVEIQCELAATEQSRPELAAPVQQRRWRCSAMTMNIAALAARNQ